MAQTEIHVPPGLTTDGLIRKRYLARLVDVFAISFLSVLCFGAVRAFVPEAIAGIAMLMLVPVVWIGYGAVQESSAQQATLGKRLMGLKVYDLKSGRVAFTQAAGRTFLKDGPFIVLSLVPGGTVVAMLLLVAHVIVLHRSPVYQAIHDRVIGTWVAAPEESTQLRLS